MTSLSAVILTHNEEKHLPGCLDSVQWADEVLVLDSFSTDRTLETATARGARVAQRAFVNYAAQRETALTLARGEWVLFVDADERVSHELRGEIAQLLAPASARPSAVGYWIPRQNYIFGAWIKHAGWYPDRQLRLMLRGCAHYDPSRPVHELVRLEGEAGTLQAHLIHLNYETVGEFIRKQKHYARYDAEKLQTDGVRARPHHFVVQPLREFRRRLFTLEGWRDGWRGWLLSVLMAWYTFEVYLDLSNLARKKERSAGPQKRTGR